MKKKILLTLAIVAVFTCLFALCVSAAEIERGGIYYTLNSDGTATVNATNRTECKVAIVRIPATIQDDDGNEYKVTRIGDTCFGNGGAEGNQYLEELYIPSTIVSVGKQLTRGCTKLRKVVIASQDTSLLDGTFWSCSSLQELDMSGMKNLTKIENIASGAPLTTVKLPSTLKSIGGKAFQSGNITSIVLPSGLTTIGSNALQSNDIETLVLPATLTSVGGAAFHSMWSIKTLVFGNTSFDGWSTNVTFTSVNPEIIFFAGSDPTTLTNHYTQWASYKTMSYKDYLAVQDKSTIDKKTIVFGTENCSCGYIRTNDPAIFSFTSYTEKMTYGKTCAHCGNTDVTKTVDAMFENLGWTAPIDGGAASIRYKVNRNSIQVYFNETGKTVEYGMYATVKDVLGENEIIDANGDAGNGAALVFVSKEFVNLEIKLLGIGENQKDTLFALGAFVKETTEDSVTYKLLEYAKPKENDKYYFTSFNEIINK